MPTTDNNKPHTCGETESDRKHVLNILCWMAENDTKEHLLHTAACFDTRFTAVAFDM